MGSTLFALGIPSQEYRRPAGQAPSTAGTVSVRPARVADNVFSSNVDGDGTDSMATLGSLPAIDDCIEVYLTAHAAFGDEPFSTTDLTAHVDEHDFPEHDRERLLTLLVAYGLLEQFDGEQYRIRCLPDERVARWRDRSLERAETLHRLVAESTPRRGGALETATELVRRDGDVFASVFVFDHDDLESVTATALPALSRDDVTGIVLRTPGDAAGHVQQLADRLCSPEITDRTDLERPLEKGASDVVGDSKDHLEFRLFLRTR